MARKFLTHILSEPLGGATAAKVDIHVGDGNLTIDRLTSGEPLVASGTLQYLENQAPPTRLVHTDSGQASLTLKAGGKGQPWVRLPWATCNGATVWQIHLNPTVALDITARTGGGNVQIDLTGMAVSRVIAETGGGNLDVVLPDDAACLSVTARTGAGNVTFHIPDGIAAKIYATSGLGKVMVDPRFSKLNENTYQSPGYDQASNKAEVTIQTGAGRVKVEERFMQPTEFER